ncbi:MAG: hypothetical protein NWS61_07125 [Schleiferiaceae bacterium]|jgi:hypothetical protein|nr:hypothetical protein [Schleiferiaceae bacterium]MDP4758529.1 hypothetical protein [Schleiferiaceae bacterium]
MKLNKLWAFAAAASLLAACNGGGTDPEPVDPSVIVTKSGVITANETWSADSIYVLNGRVVVGDGATLTVEAGTIIKGKEGDGANASCLIVGQGGKLDAQGTADNPIVMTSVLDNINVGQRNGSNLDETDKGLWGGLIVLGKATISADAATALIEGLPANEPWAIYGGSDDADNSGSITYISVRHGGTLIGDGNEINGITFGGVGNGTTVSNIEVFATLDDGVEFFGGSVNATNVSVTAQGDDAFDIDQAYSGTIDNFVYVAGDDSDHGLEIDGPEGSATGSFTLKNGTLLGGNGEYADFRDGAMGSVENVFFFGFSTSSDFEIDDSTSSYNHAMGLLNFSNVEINTSHLTSGNMSAVSIFQDKFLGTSFAGGTVVNEPTYGATAADFAWTLTAKNGNHDDFTGPFATPNNVVVSGQTGDAKWSAARIYELQGRVIVAAGDTLTIEPGTIIKGGYGQGANSSVIVVAQGGYLDARGTATQPIIMTSIADNIQIGQTAGTNLDETDAGLWGGLIVLGYAPISADASTALIEGLPANEPYAIYGGSDAADNSGMIEYVSVRHGGTLIGDGNEINGITFGGVGSGTTVDNIEVVANVDDGVEFFGGSVNASNIVVWAQGDDAYDIDQAYSGTIDNFVYVAGADSDHGMEVDGPEGTMGAGFTAKNGTLYGMTAEIADFRDSAMGTVENIYIADFDDAGDWEIDETGGAYNYDNALLNFSSIEINLGSYSAGTTLADIFLDKSGAVTSWNPSDFATSVTTPTVGADESKLAWTYAAMKGAF